MYTIQLLGSLSPNKSQYCKYIQFLWNSIRYQAGTRFTHWMMRVYTLNKNHSLKKDFQCNPRTNNSPGWLNDFFFIQSVYGPWLFYDFFRTQGVAVSNCLLTLHVAKTVPASYVLPLQTVPDPFLIILDHHCRHSAFSQNTCEIEYYSYTQKTKLWTEAFFYLIQRTNKISCIKV